MNEKGITLVVFILTLSMLFVMLPSECRGTGNIPTLSINIYSIYKIDDDFEGGLQGEADWYYDLSVYDGEWHNITRDCEDNHDYLLVNRTHNFTVDITQIKFEIKLMEKDPFAGDDDLADISGFVGGGVGDDTSWRRGAVYVGYYSLKNNSLWGDETMWVSVFLQGYTCFMTSGELPPDNSTTKAERDAAVYFGVKDNYDAPDADAGSDKTVYTNELVNFDASTSSGSLLQTFEWDLNGDGIYDEEGKKISHYYPEPGSYVVTLRVTDNLGESDTDTCTVHVLNRKPVPKFNYSPIKPSTDALVQFTDLSDDPDGTIISWQWNFGDGHTSSQRNPTHRYSDDGTYTVTLTVTDDDGATDSSTSYIYISNRPPNADFGFYPPDPDTSDSIQFTDKSSDDDGFVSLWNWEFGDGYSSNQRNPIHKYTNDGTYTVTLTVTDDDGASDSVTKQITISYISPSPPVANFSFEPISPKPNEVIEFTDNSYDTDGSIHSWYWEFGDGTTSSNKNPSHAYSERGEYLVNLTVTDNDGYSDSFTSKIMVGGEEGGGIPGFEMVALLVAMGIVLWMKRKK
ncbi:MAG: hypothetical protein DRP50_08590 [Thermotoga sp.]|nr:MAG: hypothetical protein DRP50_08590 [Thermotoga sp.]